MENSIIMNAVGDVWFGDHPVCIGHGVNSTVRRKGPESLFLEIRNSFLDGDINFCNLESVLSVNNLKSWYLPSAEMRGFPECIQGLKVAKINVVNVANNHILQHGASAYYETLDILKHGDISCVGINENSRTNLFSLIKGDIRVFIISYSLHHDEYYKGNILYSYRKNPDIIIEEVKEIIAKNDGFFICSLHWGNEFINYPSPKQVLLARKLIDSGVKIVIGHHPHVLQGVEDYNGGLIAYSLGNFVFDLWPENTKESMILKIRIVNNDMFDYKIIPVCINDNFQPTLATGDKKKQIEDNISKYNKMINGLSLRTSENDYLMISQKIDSGFRLSSYKYFIQHFYKYSLLMLIQSIGRTLIRKILFQFKRSLSLDTKRQVCTSPEISDIVKTLNKD